MASASCTHIPADATRLIDLFMGSGTVSLKLADRFQSVLLSDVNPFLVDFMRQISPEFSKNLFHRLGRRGDWQARFFVARLGDL